MKTLTILQPWAGFIMAGEKRIETRGWRTNVRGRVAIHAAASKKHLNDWMDAFRYPQADLNWHCLEFGCILGTVEIVDCVPLDKLAEHGYRQLDTEKERMLGDWSPGRYGFILRNPILFDKPIAAKGNQGWWNWNPPCAENEDAPRPPIERRTTTKYLKEVWEEMKPGQRLYVADSKDYGTDEDGNMCYRFTGPMTEARMLAYQHHRALYLYRLIDEKNIYCLIAPTIEGEVDHDESTIETKCQ